MDYRGLFDSMHPGFFDDPGIKNKAGDQVFAELVMDLRKRTPDPVPFSFAGKIQFGMYHGDIEKIRAAVGRVDEEWPRYFCEKTGIFCAFDGSSIASFCILEDWGHTGWTSHRWSGVCRDCSGISEKGYRA